MEYTPNEKEIIIKKYLDIYEIKASDTIVKKISVKVAAVPREIHNLCIKIRDYVITQNLVDVSQGYILTELLREKFLQHSQIEEGGMTPLHAKYLEILEKADRPLGVKAIAVQL